MWIMWLVCTTENKSYLREYDVVGVRWFMYIGKYIGSYIQRTEHPEQNNVTSVNKYF